MSSNNKPSKPFPRRCFTCRTWSVEQAHEERSVNARYDGTTFELLLRMPINRCTNCGASTLDDASEEAINRALRDHLNLLHPEEIMRNRRMLDLTQQQLAEKLGCAAESICRWERGLSIQSRLYDRMLRAYFCLPELRRFFDALVSNPSPGR